LLGAPCLAADAASCRALRERRDSLGERAMQEEIALVKKMRERTCPALNRAAEAANANAGAGATAGAFGTEQNFAPIDYGALIDCRRRAEAQLERTHPMLYRNRLQFTFFTAAGADLARQADAVARQMGESGCPAGR
jgi:hypothetical protein